MATLAIHSVQEEFEKCGQGHVFDHFEELTCEQQNCLLSQAESVDLESLSRLLGSASYSEDSLNGLEPIDPIRKVVHGGDPRLWAAAGDKGEKYLRLGRVALYTVAGGQGTRLGFDGPKGLFSISPVKGKSLFQIFAEKVVFAQKRYNVVIPWVVMTSPFNHEETVGYFEANDCFGLEVCFVKQGVMPMVDLSGKIVMEDMSTIAMGPDGHGGAIAAIGSEEVMGFLDKFGVEVLSYCQIDNPFVRCIDPEFIGFHVGNKSQMSSKMVNKAYPDEKVGIFCKEKGRLCIKEYSDLPSSMLAEKREDGGLLYDAANIAVHLIDKDFILKMNQGEGIMPFHHARKTISISEGSEIVAKKVIKFEKFIFDALRFAENPLVMEVMREEEFSPVKNAHGVDSIDTCRVDLLKQYVRWLSAVGERVPVGASGVPNICFEISYLFADTESSFVDKWNELLVKPKIKENTYIHD